MRTVGLQCVWVSALVMVLALSSSGFAQESEATAPGKIPASQQRVEAAGGEKADRALPQRVESLEQQMAELRRMVARLQDTVSPASGARASSDVQERVTRLEQQNQEDHRAIWDLYERLQQLEQSLAQTRAELNQRIGALSDTNASLRQQLQESQAREENKKKLTAGYPGIRRVVIDNDGRRYIEYDR